MIPRTFKKEEFLRIIRKRPATIRKLVNPSNEILTSALATNNRCIEFLDPEQKTKELLECIISSKDAYYWISYTIESFPQTVKDIIDPKVLQKFLIDHISESSRPTIKRILEQFSFQTINSMDKEFINSITAKALFLTPYFEVPYSTWLNYVEDLSKPKSSIYGSLSTTTEKPPISYSTIPREYRTPELLKILIDKFPAFGYQIPESDWTEKLAIETQQIQYIPKSLRTPDYYIDLFNKNSNLRLDPLSYAKIPENCLSEDIIVMALKSCPKHNHQIPKEQITERIIRAALKSNFITPLINRSPESIWTESLALDVVRTSGKLVKELPEKVRTINVYKEAFRNNPNIYLGIQKIKFCDKELAELITSLGNNLDVIPEELKTKEICRRCLLSYSNNINYIPSHFIDEDMIANYYASLGNESYVEEREREKMKNLSEKFLGTSLILKIAQIDQKNYDKGHRSRGLSLYLETYPKIKKDLWPQIIKVSPISLKLLSKTQQTDEIITIFFQNASLDLIEELAEYIHMKKIKKEHVPFLVGTECLALQEIIERTIGKTVSNSFQTPSEDYVIINMSDSEFLDIQNKLKTW
jgi:hypothetical protein